MAFLVSIGTLLLGLRNSKTAQKALAQKADETYVKQLEDRIGALEKELASKTAENVKLIEEKFSLMERLFRDKK